MGGGRKRAVREERRDFRSLAVVVVVVVVAVVAVVAVRLLLRVEALLDCGSGGAGEGPPPRTRCPSSSGLIG